MKNTKGAILHNKKKTALYMLYVNHCVKERKQAATIGGLTQTT